MRLLLATATWLLLALPAPAISCASEPMTEAVLFDRPPLQRPPGYLLLKVVAPRESPDDGRLLVKMAEPARAQILGPAAWLLPQPMSSCTTWGRRDADAYVVARNIGTLRGRPLFSAVVYTRSRWDWFWNLFGWETYMAPREPLRLV